jgi:hypothetical protein
MNMWLKKSREWCLSFEKKWQDSSGLPFWEVAKKEFSQHNWGEGFDLDSVMLDFITSTERLSQLNSSSDFGRPPLTLYFSKDRSFVLELYVWTDAHTNTHGHGFEGSFHVLQGSSIESLYDFETREIIGHSSWGELIPKEVVFLKEGTTRPILPNSEMIHRVLHLAKLTITLALRTVSKDTANPQMSYSFGCLASPSFPGDSIIIKLRILQWYLEERKTPPALLINQLVNYRETWDKLLSFEDQKNLTQKIAVIHGKELLVENWIKQRAFKSIFIFASTVEDKAYIAAYDFFGCPRWSRWISEVFDVEEIDAVETLKKLVLSFSPVARESTLFKPLFE